jgi:heme iron utilization protein
MDTEAREQLANLLNTIRWSTLATVNTDGTPLASEVAFVTWTNGKLLVHLSQLARHTRNLLERPHCSLSVAELDDGRADPQTLARTSLQGHASVINRDAPRYEIARDAYLARLPEAEPRFDFGDFHLFELTVSNGQFVGGFARAFKISAGDL